MKHYLCLIMIRFLFSIFFSSDALRIHAVLRALRVRGQSSRLYHYPPPMVSGTPASTPGPTLASTIHQRTPDDF